MAELAVAVAISTASVQAACPRSELPSVITTVAPAGPPNFDASRSASEVNRLFDLSERDAQNTSRRIGGPPHLKLVARVAGLQSRFQGNVSLRVEAIGDGCYRAKELRLAFAIAKREIILPREIAGDECLRTAIVEHEMKHVALDDEMIRKAPMLARDVFRPVLPALNSIEASDRQAAQRLAVAIAKPALDTAVIRLAAAAKRRHLAEIDTPGEKMRMDAQCGGRAGSTLDLLEGR